MKYYKEHSVRRYGFHGTSHRFVSGRAVELLGKGKKLSDFANGHEYFGFQKNTLVRKLDEYWFIVYSLCIDCTMGNWGEFWVFVQKT